MSKKQKKQEKSYKDQLDEHLKKHQERENFNKVLEAHLEVLFSWENWHRNLGNNF